MAELHTFDGFAKKDGRKVSEADFGTLKNAALIVEDGRIQWCGPDRKIPPSLVKPVRQPARQPGRLPARQPVRQPVREISLDRALVMPSFVECHTHLVYAGDRSQEFELRNQGVSYKEIAARGGGILSTMRATRQASAGKLLERAQFALDRFVEQGVTVVEVKSGYALDEAGELKMLQVANKLRRARIVTTFLGAHALPPEFGSTSAYLDFLVGRLLPKVRRRKLSSRVDIFLEKGFFERPESESYLLAARDLGFQITLHADQLSLSGGTDLGVELGALSVDHVLQIKEEQVRKLARSSTTAVLLPLADLYLSCPYPRARLMIDEGVRVALATDFNPGSSPCQDLQLVGLLARLEMKMSLAEVLCAYTFGAAAALGLQSEQASLQVGKRADFITLNCGLNELFYSPGRPCVRSVYRDGALQ
ncbi:MAG: imidazolonepropionase [Bdellovibrio sp.]|nr:MAG: imidazolonepropionase [Bdellovibrio sp.]